MKTMHDYYISLKEKDKKNIMCSDAKLFFKYYVTYFLVSTVASTYLAENKFTN